MKLYYSVNCGKDCEYYSNKHLEEKWKDALLYGEILNGYKVSNFGGITKDGQNDKRYFDKNDGEIYIKINEKYIKLYVIIASTFLPEPVDGYGDKNNRKHVHHRDNNSYNFNPDNMMFLDDVTHGKQPHLKLPYNDEWNILIDKICKND